MDSKFTSLNQEQMIGLSEKMDEMVDQRDYHKQKNRFLRGLLTDQQY